MGESPLSDDPLTPGPRLTPRGPGIEPDRSGLPPLGLCAAQNDWPGSILVGRWVSPTIQRLAGPYRWVLSPIDQTSHRLKDSDQLKHGGESTMSDTVEAICRHAMPRSVAEAVVPVPPDPYSVCEVCSLRDAPLVPLPPMFGRDSLRLPASGTAGESTWRSA
jgi:hypothetical protein